MEISSRLSRRRALGLCAAAPMVLAAPRLLAQGGAAEGLRRFRVLRDGSEIGSQSVEVRRAGDETFVRTKIDIAAKVLGLTVYRYALDAREHWRGGRLIGLEGETDDDGEANVVKAALQGDALIVEGSGHQGPAPADVAPTSYWSPDFLRRGTWISTQSGALLDVRTAEAGARAIPTAGGEIEAREWAVSGDLELSIFFVGGQWAGTAFDAGGEPGLIAPLALDPALPALPGAA